MLYQDGLLMRQYVGSYKSISKDVHPLSILGIFFQKTLSNHLFPSQYIVGERKYIPTCEDPNISSYLSPRHLSPRHLLPSHWLIYGLMKECILGDALTYYKLITELVQILENYNISIGISWLLSAFSSCLCRGNTTQ